MRAVVISECSGPASITIRDVEEPGSTHELGGPVVALDVHAAGVCRTCRSFPVWRRPALFAKRHRVVASPWGIA